MKKLGLLISIVIIITSCTIKKVIVTPVKSNRGDAVFSLIIPKNNYGKIEVIHVYAWTQNSQLNVNRVLIDFALSNIPRSSIIESAFLDLYHNPTSVYSINGDRGSYGEDSILIQRVISEWNENNVNWNNQPKTTSNNQVIIPKNEDRYANYENIDVTNLIQDIIGNNINERYGIMIRHKNEQPCNVVFFASSNHPNKQLHPKLRIYYRKS
ncbi:MAG: DNRLRE domain-containing protein [Bacteroidales bacterium]|nr:DNRLRE domain-containing protein [Bacteroidales bacterium]